jgi:hypothetical protein
MPGPLFFSLGSVFEDRPYRRTGRSLNRCPQSMHFMFTRAPGPAWVNGCVWADPHDGHTGRAGPSRERGG